MTKDILVPILLVTSAVLIFFVLRSVLLWYWKVDRIVENQERQIELLTAIYKRLDPSKGSKAVHDERNL